VIDPQQANNRYYAVTVGVDRRDRPATDQQKNTTCWSQVVFCPGHARYSPMAFCITLAISRNFVMMMALVMLLRNPPITGTTKNASLE